MKTRVLDFFVIAKTSLVHWVSLPTYQARVIGYEMASMPLTFQFMTSMTLIVNGYSFFQTSWKMKRKLNPLIYSCWKRLAILSGSQTGWNRMTEATLRRVWIAALRSGLYQPGSSGGCLRDDRNRFSALGVLVDVSGMFDWLPE